jgi:tRNA A-37 threonylcarbamoyl transferase component Bud32/tetratricopeptide (TPR) repeat protein
VAESQDHLVALVDALAGRYAVERELGLGGMATVYLAHDLKHDRSVALKVMHPELAASLGPERFLREIRLTARLDHPHLLPVLDSGEAAGQLWYTMPFVRGESLRARLCREMQLPVSAALDIIRQVASALDYAHREGVVHRDLKPENILLADGQARVADFGIARAVTSAEQLTGTGLAVGTPAYMSPEQASAGQVDARTDVYALGCVLYELLAGEPPFTGPTPQSVIAKRLLGRPTPLGAVRSGVPSAVEQAVSRALMAVPADRFATAAEFAEALNPAEGTLRAPVHPPRSRLATRRFTLVTIGLVLAICGALLVSRLPWGDGSAADPAWILVADLEGPPGDRTLAVAVRELVTAELEQSRVIAPMPRQQIAAVMRDAGLSDTTALTTARARELAVRSSVRAILSGSVLPVGPERYSIVLRVAEPDSGRTLFTATGMGSDQNLVPAVEKVAREIRHGLGERQSVLRANKPLIKVATPSFAAYRKYVEAGELNAKGDFAAGNRLLREAIALDTGFALAWASIGLNYLTMRSLDSAGAALAQALRRPDRLSDVERYMLEGESAYALQYDLPEAVRWYDLLLQIAPRSIIGHNDRGIYLYSLARYDEALGEFSRAVALAPFGPAQAQGSLFNQMVTLLAMGREAAAKATAGKLTGVFAEYAAQLLATYQGRWESAESLAVRTVEAPSTPSWLKEPAFTMRSGALAARGAVTAAERQLQLAASTTQGPSRRWFCHAVLLLAAASDRAPGPPPVWLLADTTSGGLLAGGLWAAAVGDTAAAMRRLTQLEHQEPVALRRLGQGPRLLRAYIEAAQGHWQEVARLLYSAGGEYDGGDPDQVSSMAVRWLLANAYTHIDQPDSAAATFQLILAPTRTPFSHLALRGLVYSFASRRLALLYGELHREAAARSQWSEFRKAFVTPDRDLARLQAGDR